MNYEDELEYARARRQRRNQTEGSRAAKGAGQGSDGNSRYTSHVDPGSRAGRSSGRNGKYRRRKNENKKKKIIIGVIVGILVLIAAAVMAVYAYIQHNLGQMDSNEFNLKEVENPNISLEMKEKMEKGYWTVAIFGLDSRDSSTGKGNRADVIMIANLNRETGEIKLVSVYRDTYLNVSDKNTYNKINAAYEQGGPEQAVKALNKNLDLNITHYAAFNWKAVATAINILGGVDIDISKAEFYYINAFITETVKGTGIGSVQLKSAGLNHLDGVQAVAYGRLRLMDSDYARVERQKLVIEKAFEKAKKADLTTLESLVAHMVQMCATNVSFGDIFPLAKNVSKYHLGESLGFPSARGEARIKIGSNSLSCIVPQTLTSNVTNLHSFLFGEENYTPSSTVQSISAHISEVSGMYKEGKEASRAATDKGYIPKATTAAATSAAESQPEEGTSESGTVKESVPGSASESESGIRESSTMVPGQTNPGESESLQIPGGLYSTVVPGISEPGHGPAHGTTGEYDRPRSPQDMTKETTEAYGPGIPPTAPSVQEATTASPIPSTTEATSVIIGELESGGPASETTAASHPGTAMPSGSVPTSSSGTGEVSGSGILSPTAPTVQTSAVSPVSPVSGELSGQGSGIAPGSVPGQ